MPRDEDDDDRPSRRKPWDKNRRDEDEDDPPRRRRRDDDDDEEVDEDRPRRRRRHRDDDDDDPLDEPGMHYVLPVNTSGLAIAAGYVGLISVLCVPAPIALILGILALVNLKKNPKLHGHGRAWFAIVMGTIFTVLPIVLLILGAIAG